MYNIKRVRDILKKGLKTPLKTGDDQKLLQHKKLGASSVKSVGRLLSSLPNVADTFAHKMKNANGGVTSVFGWQR